MTATPGKKIAAYRRISPAIREIRNSTIKMKKRIFAIETAPAAMPPKPNTAATMAIMRKITAQRNIINGFKVKQYSYIPDFAIIIP